MINESGELSESGLVDGNIREAVYLWYTNREETERKLGSISEWDVSRVTDMSWLFTFQNNTDEYLDKVLTLDLSKWDVRNVLGMQGMFANSSVQVLCSEWNASNVCNMSYMFSGVIVCLILR